MLSGRGDGDDFGTRPAGLAVGDGLPGPDARAGTRDTVATIDDVAPGGVAAMDTTAAAVGLHHRCGIPTDPILPPGAQADDQPPSPWREAEMGVGGRLLSRLRIHLQNGRFVIPRRQASPSLGAEGVPLAENETEGHLPRAALSS